MSNEGLSMVSSYSILCHHIENDNLKAEEYVKRTSNSVISLTIGVALKIEEDCIQIIGDGPVFLFESDGSQSKISGKVSLSNAKKMLQ